MRFPYIEREVDPIPGVPDSDREWEPQITVRVAGPDSIQIVPGLVDIGASLTLLPYRYLNRLGVEVVQRTRVYAGIQELPVSLAYVDLELRTTRTSYVWSALVGFAMHRQRGLWGQFGFLDHFTATFNTHRHWLTLRPNGTFPAPLFDNGPSH